MAKRIRRRVGKPVPAIIDAVTAYLEYTTKFLYVE